MGEAANTTALVYQFRVKGDIDDATLAQMRLGHELRNHLVELENRFDSAVAAAWETIPELAAAKTAVDETDAVVAGLVKRASQERMLDRSTRPRADTAAELRAAKKARTEARKTLKELKAARYPEIVPLVHDAADVRKADQKTAYRAFVDRGLYWATFNDVVDHHRTSVKNRNSARKKGKPSGLRFHRWSGEGSVAVQLQRSAGDPARTPEVLASGEGKWRNVLQVGPWEDPGTFDARERSERRRLSRTGRARVRIGCDPAGEAQWADLKVVVHRMVPADAEIVAATLSRKVVAGKPRVHLNLTVKRPVAEVMGGPTVALHSGWRSMADGRVQVASWASSSPLPEVPDHLVGIVGRSPDGTTGRVYAPGGWGDEDNQIAKVRSTQDTSRDLIRPVIADWMTEHPEIMVDRDGDPLRAQDVRLWRDPGRFAYAVATIVEHDPGSDTADQLAAWARQDRHLFQWWANQADQLAAKRTDTWRKVAAWLTATAGRVIIDDTDIQALTAVPDAGVEDEHRDRKARVNQHRTGPGELRAVVAATAKRDNIPTETAAAVSAVHVGCGGKAVDPAGVELTCAACGGTYDRELNALAALLAS